DVYEDEQGYIYLSGEMEHVNIMGFLLKINPSHEAEWMQQYLCFPDNTDAGGTYTKLYGLTPTSDGGFAMAGEYFSSDSEMFPGGTQSSLVIKVDECGCLEAGCNPDCYTSTPQVQTIRMLPLEVYPNPAGRQISISGSEAGGQLRVYNQQGQVCLETEYRAGNTLDVSALSSGVYTIRLNAGGKYHRGQFVKE
ncbi:MAG TPA: T9SS type A sorting domain-containing protein, partial [Bacteroidales bacterium]|nr:T9SS type A sorting domain-containing protein [Bacteroidales bacterium]